MRRSIAILGILGTLFISGCTTMDDGKQPLEHITLKAPVDGAAPVLDAKWPVKVAAQQAEIDLRGSGTPLTARQLVSVQATSYDAATGKPLGPTSPAATMRLTEKNLAAPVVQQITGAPSGSYVTYAVPASGSNPAQIVVAQVTAVPESGKPIVTPLDKMPRITFDAKRAPQFDNNGLGAGSQNQAAVITEGAGAALKAGDKVGVRYQAWQLSNKAALLAGDVANLAAYGQPIALGNNDLGSCIDQSLIGHKRGVSMVLLCSPTATIGASGGAIGGVTTETAEIAVYVATTLPAGATTAPVGALPPITFDSAAQPQIGKLPRATPETVLVQQLTRGSGKKITPGSNVTVKFTGWAWNDGKAFDSTYGKSDTAAQYTFTAGVNAVIPCWDDALFQQSVGSTVAIGCPASTAYGDLGVPGQPKGSLVFVVKIESAT